MIKMAKRIMVIPKPNATPRKAIVHAKHSLPRKSTIAPNTISNGDSK